MSGRVLVVPLCFPPEVALYVVKLACERPDQFGRSHTPWQCSDRAPHVDGLIRLLLCGCSRCLYQRVLFLFGCVYEDNVTDKHPWKTPKAEEEKVDGLTDLVDR